MKQALKNNKDLIIALAVFIPTGIMIGTLIAAALNAVGIVWIFG